MTMTALAPATPYTVTLPWPPNECSPNAHVNRFDKAKAAKRYRRDCKLLALDARRKAERHGMTFPLATPVSALWVFTVPRKTRRDFLNLYASVKAGEDGIVDAGVLIDDDVWRYKPTLDVEIGKQYGVKVTLTGGEG